LASVLGTRHDGPLPSRGEDRLQGDRVPFHLCLAGERGLAGLPGREEEFRDSIGLAIDYASALGCQLVHVMAGVLPGDLDRERAMETFVDNLYFTATACAEEGIG
jgi:hydroxypyruvate isomerase